MASHRLQITALTPSALEIISSHLIELCGWLKEKKGTNLLQKKPPTPAKGEGNSQP
jgi:hypothetical protein